MPSEQDFEIVAKTLGITLEEVKKRHKQILVHFRRRMILEGNWDVASMNDGPLEKYLKKMVGDIKKQHGL